MSPLRRVFIWDCCSAAQVEDFDINGQPRVMVLQIRSRANLSLCAPLPRQYCTVAAPACVCLIWQSVQRSQVLQCLLPVSGALYDTRDMIGPS